MDVAHTTPMTADEFIPWAMAQPAGHRHELMAGKVYSMAPERMGHVFVKAYVYQRLNDAIKRAGLDCHPIADGMSVRIDDHTVYEPDAAMRCGERLAYDAMDYHDPIIVVEVLSPWTQAIDTSTKLTDYFRLSGLSHYLIVNIDRRMVIHHRRGSAGIIHTSITAGMLVMNPPGITLDVASFFSPD